jgi:hypothetical protein
MFRTIQPTPEEIAKPLPGDAIVPNADVVMNRAFTLPATPEIVWPWFMQLGRNRAGWYFPRSVERFIPKRKRGLRVIDPALQNLQVGTVIDDWPGPHDTFEVAILKPARMLIYKSQRGKVSLSWAIILTATHDDQTRVQLRLRMAPVKHQWLANSVGDLFDALTVAGLAAGLRERLTNR